jgi:hypothetical protein
MVKVEIHKNERGKKNPGKFVQIINGLTSRKGILNYIHSPVVELLSSCGSGLLGWK